jgi:copper transport protein
VARLRRPALLLGLLLVGLLLGSGSASAHASLVSTSPTTRTHVDEAPSELVMRLNEPVSLVDGSVQLIDTDGVTQALSDVRLDDGGRQIVVVPAGTVPDGAYLATARVVSADTHVVSLSIQFTVGSVTEQGSFATDTSKGAEQYLNYPSKTIAYLGLVLSTGLLLASLWVWRDALVLRRFVLVYRTGAALLGLGLLGRLAVLVSQQSGGSGSLTSSAVQQVVSTPHGVVMSVGVVLSIVVVAMGIASSTLGVVHASVAILAVTLGGHGGSAAGWPWAFVGTAAHVYGITVWLGGIALLVFVVRPATNIRRWHTVAAVHVSIAVFGGLVLSVVQIQPLPALWSTTYGVVLLAKALGVVVVLVLGYLAYRGYIRDTGRRTLLAESAVASAILVLTSVLSSLTPAKDVYTTDIATSLDFGSSEVLTVGVDSIRRGPQVLTASYPSGDRIPTVSVDYSSRDANVARLPVVLTDPVEENGSTVWRSEQLVVPAPGEWKVTVRFEGANGPKIASFFYDAL